MGAWAYDVFLIARRSGKLCRVHADERKVAHLLESVIHPTEIDVMCQRSLGFLFLIWIGQPSAMADTLSAPTPSAVDQTHRVEAATPSATAAGTTFTIPSAWTARTSGQLLILSPFES